MSQNTNVRGSDGYNRILQTNFSTVYQIHGLDNYNNLLKVLQKKGFSNWIKNLFGDTSQAINSMRVYPMLSSSKFGGSTGPQIKIAGNWYDDIYNTRLDYNASKIYTIGRFNFVTENFTDYEPYTSMQLYIPFMGFIDLPVNEIANKVMWLKYHIDVHTGIATAYISVDDHIIVTKSEKIGIDIPWGTYNAGENIKNIISTLVSTAISIYTIQTSGVGKTGKLLKNKKIKALRRIGTGIAAAKGAQGIAENLQIRYERGGTAGDMSLGLMPTHPYIIKRKNTLVPIDEADYAHEYGKPLSESRVLSQLKGYTIIEEIHLQGLPNATADEIDEIEELLYSGVHL